MYKLLSAAVVAGAMLVATAGTALMATPVVAATCDADNGLATVSFIYDSSQTPPPITTVEVVNNDTHPVQIGVNFYSNTNGSLLWSGSASFNVGTTDLNVTPLGRHMVSTTNKFGTFWTFPVVVSCAG